MNRHVLSSSPVVSPASPDGPRRTTAGLSLEGVTFGYRRGEPVVCDVTARLAPGRLCCLIGPNAAGKTTLVRLMLGQLGPRAGTIHLDGERVDRMGPRARARRLSYVPQRGSVQFAFTVREVVAMGRYAAGPNDAAVAAAIEQCDLAGLEQAVFAELSGGQQQLVLIARALAQAGTTT
ncbi:MAG: ABC transporter ATP-binding protein, partial [Phycisphaeraceae bacterium]